MTTQTTDQRFQVEPSKTAGSRFPWQVTDATGETLPTLWQTRSGAAHAAYLDALKTAGEHVSVHA